MGTREPRLSLQQALASRAQPWFAGMLCAAGISRSKEPCRPLGAQNSLGAEQMSQVAFERTGAALWAQVAMFSVSRMLFFSGT